MCYTLSCHDHSLRPLHHLFFIYTLRFLCFLLKQFAATVDQRLDDETVLRLACDIADRRDDNPELDPVEVDRLLAAWLLLSVRKST